MPKVRAAHLMHAWLSRSHPLPPLPPICRSMPLYETRYERELAEHVRKANDAAAAATAEAAKNRGLLRSISSLRRQSLARSGSAKAD